jgi:DNA processing protein
MSELRYWLGFSLAPDIGGVRIQQLLSFFGSLEAAWSASPKQWQEAGIPPSTVSALEQHRTNIKLEAEVYKVAHSGAHLLCLTDEAYPRLLKKVHNPPAVLYVRGEWTAFDELALTIVGTRRATRYGRDAAFQLARDLAEQNVTIVSGLAQGIDGAAHEGALAARGRTVAVLGCGIDKMYPREHTELAQRIAENGALISEFPMGTPPNAANFPRRNRILSGLSLGVLVAEAPEKSGALITAELALEQGREVFAVPQSIFSLMGKATNRLIQEGAQLVMSANDILETLNIAHSHLQTRESAELVSPSSPEEIALLEYLSNEPIHIDELIRLSSMSTEHVVAILTLLELKGLAQMVGHMQYCRSNSY